MVTPCKRKAGMYPGRCLRVGEYLDGEQLAKLTLREKVAAALYGQYNQFVLRSYGTCANPSISNGRFRKRWPVEYDVPSIFQLVWPRTEIDRGNLF